MVLTQFYCLFFIYFIINFFDIANRKNEQLNLTYIVEFIVSLETLKVVKMAKNVNLFQFVTRGERELNFYAYIHFDFSIPL